MIVKCKECEKEYELAFTRRISDYKCKCGGDIRPLTIEEITQKGKEKLNEIKKLNWKIIAAVKEDFFYDEVAKYESLGYILIPESFSVVYSQFSGQTYLYCLMKRDY